MDCSTLTQKTKNKYIPATSRLGLWHSMQLCFFKAVRKRNMRKFNISNTLEFTRISESNWHQIELNIGFINKKKKELNVLCSKFLNKAQTEICAKYSKNITMYTRFVNDIQRLSGWIKVLPEMTDELKSWFSHMDNWINVCNIITNKFLRFLISV